MRTLFLIALLSTGACGSDDSPVDSDASADDDAANDTADASTIDGSSTPAATVYAHSATVLYELDTAGPEAVEIGPFDIEPSMADIAVDQDGVIVGITT